jgi:hypothetical protein
VGGVRIGRWRDQRRGAARPVTRVQCPVVRRGLCPPPFGPAHDPLDPQQVGGRNSIVGGRHIGSHASVVRLFASHGIFRQGVIAAKDVSVYAASRINQLRKSSSAASHSLAVHSGRRGNTLFRARG